MLKKVFQLNFFDTFQQFTLLLKKMETKFFEKSEKQKNYTPRGDRTLDLWIRSPSRYPLRYRGCI